MSCFVHHLTWLMCAFAADKEIEPLSMNDDGYFNEDGKFVRGEVSRLPNSAASIVN